MSRFQAHLLLALPLHLRHHTGQCRLQRRASGSRRLLGGDRLLQRLGLLLLALAGGAQQSLDTQNGRLCLHFFLRAQCEVLVRSSELILQETRDSVHCHGIKVAPLRWALLQGHRGGGQEGALRACVKHVLLQECKALPPLLLRAPGALREAPQLQGHLAHPPPLALQPPRLLHGVFGPLRGALQILLHVSHFRFSLIEGCRRPAGDFIGRKGVGAGSCARLVLFPKLCLSR
mmetsp:Transcript_111006/g.264877  ORF Transcript_111006/g.264877 Transcript_111006/m.264877 type:complete len:232 (-) Transcript_111006:593-1288(-)